jgi:hypothetical protein
MLRRLTIPFLLCFACAAGQTQSPDRKVDGNIISSTHDPAVRIILPTPASYVGADRWPLYDVADCEVHVWVEADAQKKVHQLYWIQFEAYLPSKPQARYNYDSPRHTTIGGMNFFVDTWVRAATAPSRSGSDREHTEALIRGKGFTMPADMAYVRLVHLVDDQNRKELMIIYGEDLAPTGLSAADLDEHGKAHGRWPEIEKGVIERAQHSLRLNP